MSKNKLEIDQDCADRITVCNLQDWRKYLKKELAQWNKNPRTPENPGGYWLHPEDVTNNVRYIAALDLIIHAYGGK
jgi:hypothetical protein